MHERYIEDCLKSLISQTYKNIELLILDDASTDCTFDIIQSYEERLRARFSNVILEKHRHNSGNVSANLNKILRAAQGAYIKTFAGDDAMLPEYVEKIVAHMEEDKEAILGYTNAYVVEDKFKLGDNPRGKCAYNEHRSYRQQDIYERLLQSNYIVAPTVMMRKRAFDEYGFYDETIKFEDYDFWLRLSRKERFTYFPQKLIYYRRAETSLTNYQTQDGRKKMKFMIVEEKKVFQKNLRGLPKDKKRLYQQYYFQQYLRRASDACLWDITIQLLIFMKKNKYEININILKETIKKRVGL